MTRPEPDDLLVRLRATRVSAAAPTPDCLDDDMLAALASGGLDAVSRATVLRHVAGCARCRESIASVSRALADPAVAREIAAVEGAPRRRLLRFALPAAAAAAIVLALARPWATEGGPGHRGPPSASPTPVPVAPVGVVAEAANLRWAGTSGADRYRVTLFDAAGRVLYEVQVADTAVAIPDSVTIVPARSYLWKVEARTGWDRWASSQLVQFSIGGRGPP